MRAAIIVLAGLLFAAPLAAQDARLARRFKAPALQRITEIIDQAATRELPVEPLIQKALEGATKGAPQGEIERALRSLADRLDTARKHLGNNATEHELSAAASALFVGVPPASLSRLRSLRPNDSLAMPLTALAFFVQKGVTADASMRWVESLVDARVAPEEFTRLQQLIENDVRAGAEARAASATRVEALLIRYRSER